MGNATHNNSKGRLSYSTGDNKVSVPRHRKQVASSADRQERAIERRERQAAAKEIRFRLREGE